MHASLSTLHKYAIMGCGGSRLDSNGMVLPPRLRPIFLHRLEEIKMRRHTRPLKDSSSTTSKKELLLHERDEDENSSSSHKNAFHSMPLISPKDNVIPVRKYEDQKGKESRKPKEEISIKNEQKDDRKHEDLKTKEESEFEDALTDAYNDDEDDDDDKEDEDGRMIGHEYDGAFPGSPSFRVYFKDDGEDKHNDLGKIKNNAFKSTISSDDTVPSKESPDQNKKVKRGRKKKSLRLVLPKGGQGAVKNLLSVKSCYSPSPQPSSDHRKNNGLIHQTEGIPDIFCVRFSSP